MPGNTGGIWRGDSIPPHPRGILGSFADGIVHSGLLWDVVPGFLGGDAGGTSPPHYNLMERPAPKHPLLCGWQHGSVIRTGMANGGFQHPGRDVWSGRPGKECHEDGQNGLLSLSGSAHQVVGGVWAAYDWGGTIILVEATRKSVVFRVWGVNGDGVDDSPSTNVAR